jgi:hypothetical protein
MRLEIHRNSQVIPVHLIDDVKNFGTFRKVKQSWKTCFQSLHLLQVDEIVPSIHPSVPLPYRHLDEQRMIGPRVIKAE